MNATQSLFAAIVLTAAAAGSAFAQEATVEAPVSTGTASRTDLAAQARQAVAQGQLHERFAINPVQAKVAGASREAVRAETRAALSSGEIARLNARTHDSAPQQARSLRVSALGN